MNMQVEAALHGPALSDYLHENRGLLHAVFLLYAQMADASNARQVLSLLNPRHVLQLYHDMTPYIFLSFSHHNNFCRHSVA
jgi:hypothetical protein